MRAAFVTTCIQLRHQNTAILAGCLASICSLLLTTAPELIVALDHIAFQSVGALLQQRYNLTVLRLPPLNVSTSIRRNWTALNAHGARRRSRLLPLESYSAHRFELWRLVRWDKLLYFDAADVIFLRNASQMLELSQPFSSIRIRHDAEKPRCWPTPGTLLPIEPGVTHALDYINAGLFVFRPSAAVADVLVSTYLSGRFVYCGGSDMSLGNQDVIRQLALETSLLGAFHEWPLCFNHRGWAEQRNCERKEMYLIHGPKRYGNLVLPGRAKVKVSELETLMREGKCAPQLRRTG